MGVPLPNVEVDFEAPTEFANPKARKPTVDEALEDVEALCDKVKHGKPLYERFRFVSSELQDKDSNNPIVGEFTETLGEFWRVLYAFDFKTPVERMLSLDDHHQRLAKVHDDVEALARKAGLQSTASGQEQLKKEIADEKSELVAWAKNPSEVVGEFRGLESRQDAVVLLKAALDDLSLDVSSRDAATRVLHTLVSDRQFNVTAEATPEWFLPENALQIKSSPIKGCKGSFGSIHFAKLHKVTDVVVKYIDNSLDQTTKEALKHEANTLNKLRHRYIVSMIGANHAATRPFLVMDYAANGTMQDYLQRPGNENKVWQLLYEGAQGLMFLHERNVVHADLKLDNILISRDGEALISDFGLSRTKARHGSKTKCTTLCKNGTQVYGGLYWRAPEYDAYMPQFASDVYSYAMCIYQAFAGEPPYAGDSDDEVKRKIANNILPTQPVNMSNEVWDLIKSMTNREMKERITMDKVLEALKGFAQAEYNRTSASALQCGKCPGRRQDKDAKFCSQCASPLAPTEAPAADLLDRIPSDLSAAQQLFRQVRFGSQSKCSRDQIETLRTVALDAKTDWKTALYAFGTLHVIHRQTTDVAVITNDEIKTLQVDLDSLVEPHLDEVDLNSLFSSNRDVRFDAELVELLVRLDSRNKNMFRSQMTELGRSLRTTNDESERRAILSALVELVDGDSESQVELQRLPIGDVLVLVLRHSSNVHDKANAAILLGMLVLAIDKLTNADAIAGALIDEVRKGDASVLPFVTQAIANFATTNAGAKAIGFRGGVAPLLELLQPETDESLARLGLHALSQLVKDPSNGVVFAHAGGLAKLEWYSQRVSDDGMLDFLGSVCEIVDRNTELGGLVAANDTILRVCVQCLSADYTEHVQRRAANVCYEFARKHTQAIEAINRLNGFRQLIASAKSEAGNPFAEDTIVSAIKTLLSELGYRSEPNEEPQPGSPKKMKLTYVVN